MYLKLQSNKPSLNFFVGEHNKDYLVYVLKVNKALPKEDRKRKAAAKVEGGQAQKKTKTQPGVSSKEY